MTEPYLSLSATEFLLKNGVTKKEIKKRLQQERAYIMKHDGIPRFFDKNTGCTLVKISLDGGMALYDKNYAPIAVMNENGKEITDSGYFSLTIDLLADNEFLWY
jgi:hypothetical protein